MALFPLTSNFEGDFVLQLVAVDTEIASATCEQEPVCALVVAVYAPQAW